MKSAKGGATLTVDALRVALGAELRDEAILLPNFALMSVRPHFASLADRVIIVGCLNPVGETDLAGPVQAI
jgi:hypothetical protein